MAEPSARRLPPAPVYADITGQFLDDDLRTAVLKVISLQRAAGPRGFVPDPAAANAVSPEALDTLLREDAAVSDIVVTREISNCVAYNFDNVRGALMRDDLASLRERIDRGVHARLGGFFSDPDSMVAENTGHFWYPPGGFMGWHTNLRTPGWRLYITHCDEAGKSFFRYRDPVDGQVHTEADDRWNVRLFTIDPDRPLWHAVYSDTHRFSFGYKIHPAAAS